ncbi:MAG: hypothetical protein ACLFN8_01000 [Candidatus Woesearchaeota archaeon]
MKKIIMIISLVALLLVAACTQDNAQENNELSEDVLSQDDNLIEIGNENQEEELPEIAATANGDIILTEEVLSFQSQMMMQGVQLNLDDALTELINRRLIIQEAKNRGYEVTIQDVKDLFLKQGFEEEQLKETIDSQGMNYEEFLESQMDDTLFILLLEEEKEKVEVTDENAQAFYEENKHLLEENVTYEEVEQEIYDILKEQESMEALTEILNEALLTAEIEKFI